ncbi:MAG: hypothetical protein Q9226_008229, partial [Calogaya cf. arnoldii]
MIQICLFDATEVPHTTVFVYYFSHSLPLSRIGTIYIKTPRTSFHHGPTRTQRGQQLRLHNNHIHYPGIDIPQACCTVPPAVVGDYKAKGDYIDLDGMQVCTIHSTLSSTDSLLLTQYSSDTTGPSTATSAIFIIYDIFGFSPQALQGADILAHADQHHQYQVFIPDFFKGKPLPLSVFPPDNEEKKKQM